MSASFTESISSFMSNGGLLIIMMVALVAVMIIPQRKRDKKVKEMLANVKVGDRIRTIGGIYGTVCTIKDDVITIMVGPDKVRLVFTRGAIATVENVPAENAMEEEVKEAK